MTNRHVLTVDLKDDPEAIVAYREHHRQVWPEVVASLRCAGVERLDIHLLGRRLVMIVELRDGLDVAAAFSAHVASSAIVAEWERLMKALQEPAPGAAPGEWWAAMEPVFVLNGNEPALAPMLGAAKGADRTRTS
jgi:L-rhamnose mutarotase